MKLNQLKIGGRSKASLFISESEAGDVKTEPKSKCSIRNPDVGACDLSKIDKIENSICIPEEEGLNYKTSLRDLMIEGRVGGSPKET